MKERSKGRKKGRGGRETKEEGSYGWKEGNKKEERKGRKGKQEGRKGRKGKQEVNEEKQEGRHG